MAMSKAVPCMCFEAGAPPTARLCSGLRYADRTISGLPGRSRRACSLSTASVLILIAPVPRQAISAAERFGQRQAVEPMLIGQGRHGVLQMKSLALGWGIRSWWCGRQVGWACWRGNAAGLGG